MAPNIAIHLSPLQIILIYPSGSRRPGDGKRSAALDVADEQVGDAHDPLVLAASRGDAQ